MFLDALEGQDGCGFIQGTVNWDGCGGTISAITDGGSWVNPDNHEALPILVVVSCDPLMLEFEADILDGETVTGSVVGIITEIECP